MPVIKQMPQFIDIAGNKRLVVLPEEEYDRLLDIIDNVLAAKIESDKTDPVIDFDKAKKMLSKKIQKPA